MYLVTIHHCGQVLADKVTESVEFHMSFQTGQPLTDIGNRKLSDPCYWASRLPLPGCLMAMFPEEVDSQTEDSALHGGRIRSFKHERGNWATYIYLPCKTETLHS